MKNTIFVEKMFADCSLVPRQRTTPPQILRRKLSRIATKPRNSRVFSLESFPLYGSASWSHTLLLLYYTTHCCSLVILIRFHQIFNLSKNHQESLHGLGSKVLVPENMLGGLETSHRRNWKCNTAKCLECG